MKSLLLLLLLVQSWLVQAKVFTVVRTTPSASCPVNADALDNAAAAAVNFVLDEVRRNLRLGQRELTNCCRLCQGWTLSKCWVLDKECHLSIWDPTKCRRRLEEDEGKGEQQELAEELEEELAECQSAFNEFYAELSEDFEDDIPVEACLEWKCLKLFGNGR